jgi:hypothetical protein
MRVHDFIGLYFTVVTNVVLSLRMFKAIVQKDMTNVFISIFSLSKFPFKP